MNLSPLERDLSAKEATVQLDAICRWLNEEIGERMKDFWRQESVNFLVETEVVNPS